MTQQAATYIAALYGTIDHAHSIHAPAALLLPSNTHGRIEWTETDHAAEGQPTVQYWTTWSMSCMSDMQMDSPAVSTSSTSHLARSAARTASNATLAGSFSYPLSYRGTLRRAQCVFSCSTAPALKVSQAAIMTWNMREVKSYNMHCSTYQKINTRQNDATGRHSCGCRGSEGTLGYCHACP